MKKYLVMVTSLVYHSHKKKINEKELNLLPKKSKLSLESVKAVCWVPIVCIRVNCTAGNFKTWNDLAHEIALLR